MCVLVVLLASCGGDDEPPLPAPSAAQAPAQGTAIDSSWPPIGRPAATAPRASEYPGGGGLRFVIFGASWCPGCVASTLEDAALARRYANRVTVGIAVHGDSDIAFTSSRSARYLDQMPIWRASSTTEVAQLCGVRFLPYACLVDGARVIWRGGSSDAPAIIDAHLAGTLDTALARHAQADALIDRARAGDAQARPQALAALRGLASRENDIAWRLVDRDTVPAADAELAVALAQDAVEATGAMNSAILDTLAVALWKASRREDAARVAQRVIAVCDATGASCSEERPRAEEYVRTVRGG
ncbi:MAG: hypothetical protein M5U28_30060 [Sandaracinaceae bacterium]|nr:hypothetical protein [Sandaracinaceae bacterium]